MKKIISLTENIVSHLRLYKNISVSIFRSSTEVKKDRKVISHSISHRTQEIDMM